MGLPAENIQTIDYWALPTGLRFHNSMARQRAIVGPVGSGKTSMGAWDICYYLPHFLRKEYKWKHTKWVVVRNTYRELIDTTQATIFEWFPWGDYYQKREMYTIEYPDGGPVLDILFRACDQKKHIRQFKSLELTGFWNDESIEISPIVKLMLQNRIGRYPKMRCKKCNTVMKTVEAVAGEMDFYRCPECRTEEHPKYGVKFGIETTNPPDIEHPTYSEYDWGDHPPPGPLPSGKPKPGYAGFWQPPRENSENLSPGYYSDLLDDYRDQQDWAEMYVEGKPGIMVKGKLIYANFKRKENVATEPLIWAKGDLIRGWDNSGSCPACVIIQIPTANHVQILKEFTTDKQGIVDFGNAVKAECETLYPGAKFTEWADPAGENKFSKPQGGFTSNAQLMRDECEIDTKPSDQNLTARIQSVDKQLGIKNGLLIDPGCTRLINGFLGGYCYPEIGTTGEYSNEPMKNRYSHPQDGLQYAMVKIALTDHESLFGIAENNSMFVD